MVYLATSPMDPIGSNKISTAWWLKSVPGGGLVLVYLET